jgi:hypothetical protein
MNQDNGQGQFSGQGGSYVVDAGGDHNLVGRTRNPGDPDPEDAAPDQGSTPEQPASAGIFSPVVPAEQPTEE